MFARFNLELNKDDLTANYQFQSFGLKQLEGQKLSVHKVLDTYLTKDGFLNASEIENDWFPEVNANVFLSHSHQDEQAVIQLAGFLYIEYGITSFVDSTVWGYANALLKKIDDNYCVGNRKVNGSSTYNYDKRNQSTAHVHMILQGALAKMIDRSEAILFINTPSSLLTSNIGDDTTTASPWIYSELLMANTFPARPYDHYNKYNRKRSSSTFGNSELKVAYKVGLSSFVDIDLADIKRSALKVEEKNARNVLDQLYLDKGLLVNNTAIKG